MRYGASGPRGCMGIGSVSAPYIVSCDAGAWMYRELTERCGQPDPRGEETRP